MNLSAQNMLQNYYIKYQYLVEGSFFADSLFFDSGSKFEIALAHSMEKRIVYSGSEFIKRGEMPFGIYVLREGQARMILLDGQKRLIEPNEILGLTELLKDSVARTTAVALTDCRFYFINRQDFLEFMQSEPEFCFRLLKLLAVQYNRSYQRLLGSGKRSNTS